MEGREEQDKDAQLQKRAIRNERETLERRGEGGLDDAFEKGASSCCFHIRRIMSVLGIQRLGYYRIRHGADGALDVCTVHSPF